MKKYLAFLLALLMTLSALGTAAWAAPAEPRPTEESTVTEAKSDILAGVAPTEEPTVTEVFSDILREMEPAKCKAAILMDADTGEVLYELNSHEQNYPASITKVMTALMTLEAVDRGELGLEELVTASSTFGYDLESGGTTQNIKEGEQLSVLELLYCALMPSANEACNILAERVGGNIPDFVDRMNVRAAELGMADTHFANAHGLHNANHYTSAHDVAVMTREALKNDVFRTIVSARSHTVPATNLHAQRKLNSTNALVNPLYNGKYTYPQAIGVKTGSTSAAGKCLVSAAVSRGRTLICVVLGAQEVEEGEGGLDRRQFSESKRLLKWGFENFERKVLVDAKRPVKEIPVELSADVTSVALKPQTDLELTLPKDLDPADFQQDIVTYYSTVEAPVEAGQILGELTVRNGQTTYGTVKLVAAASAQRSEFLYWLARIGSFFSQTWVKAALVALGVLIVFLILRFGVFKPRKGYHGRKNRRKKR